MQHYYTLSFIITGILFAGCKKQTQLNSDETSGFYTIDFEQSVDSEKQMAISEIADRIEYIELKTPEDIIITRIHDI